ncbi:MAG: hypothetical protein LBK82_16840, partial [Planctomycetaceae bacterium]|nr:hypothetical protein [Planctomycetaceae bacterium]
MLIVVFSAKSHLIGGNVTCNADVFSAKPHPNFLCIKSGAEMTVIANSMTAVLAKAAVKRRNRFLRFGRILILVLNFSGNGSFCMAV